MNYPEFIFSQLLCVYDDAFRNLPYDEQYEQVPILYKDFESSAYNNAVKYSNETARMCNYLSADQHKKVQLGDEIVESLKQFDDIDPEVWKYVSKKLGFTNQERVEVPSINLTKTKTII
jgi:hypothetical protein